MKKRKKGSIHEEARELRLNKGLSIKELAIHYGKSERTIYRWLKRAREGGKRHSSRKRRKKKRKRKYPVKVFRRIIELKTELPQRSAPMVRRILKGEFPNNCPSVSTVRKYIRDKRLPHEERSRKKGFSKFERDKPNDLWQIDIAGVQGVKHLGKTYLIALIDDCSRFILSAKYFKNQEGKNVMSVVRDAILAHGRPNQVLADNGAQFRNVIGDLGTKYSRFLEHLDVEPIFATPGHPETKGKIERWFRTVKQMFLPEARLHFEDHPKATMTDLNEILSDWVAWYNAKKPHRNLPENGPPKRIFLETEDRVFRPLKARVNWKRWLHEVAKRKVTKYNEISYKAQKFAVPPGYSGSRVEVIEYEDKIEIYFKDHLLITHPYEVVVKKKRKTRKISHNGTIKYLGKHYTIDYKLAGKTVEVQEINDGRTLLVYLHGELLRTLTL